MREGEREEEREGGRAGGKERWRGREGGRERRKEGEWKRNVKGSTKEAAREVLLARHWSGLVGTQHEDREPDSKDRGTEEWDAKNTFHKTYQKYLSSSLFLPSSLTLKLSSWEEQS